MKIFKRTRIIHWVILVVFTSTSLSGKISPMDSVRNTALAPRVTANLTTDILFDRVLSTMDLSIPSSREEKMAYVTDQITQIVQSAKGVQERLRSLSRMIEEAIADKDEARIHQAVDEALSICSILRSAWGKLRTQIQLELEELEKEKTQTVLIVAFKEILQRIRKEQEEVQKGLDALWFLDQFSQSSDWIVQRGIQQSLKVIQQTTLFSKPQTLLFQIGFDPIHIEQNLEIVCAELWYHQKRQAFKEKLQAVGRWDEEIEKKVEQELIAKIESAGLLLPGFAEGLIGMDPIDEEYLKAHPAYHPEWESEIESGATKRKQSEEWIEKGLTSGAKWLRHKKSAIAIVSIVAGMAALGGLVALQVHSLDSSGDSIESYSQDHHPIAKEIVAGMNATEKIEASTETMATFIEQEISGLKKEIVSSPHSHEERLELLENQKRLDEDQNRIEAELQEIQRQKEEVTRRIEEKRTKEVQSYEKKNQNLVPGRMAQVDRGKSSQETIQEGGRLKIPKPDIDPKSPSQNRVVWTLQTPLAGFFVKEVTNDFDVAQGGWRFPERSQDNTPFFLGKEVGVIENRLLGEIESSLTSLPIPWGYAPVAESFQFSEGDIEYSLHQDAFGSFWLYTSKTQITCSFGIGEYHQQLKPPSVNSHDFLKMVQGSLMKETESAIDHAKRLSTDKERISYFIHFIEEGSEYSLGKEMDKKHHEKRGQLVNQLDKVRKEGYRYLECEQLQTLICAFARELGIAARFLNGIQNNGDGELTTHERHTKFQYFDRDWQGWSPPMEAQAPDRFDHDASVFEQSPYSPVMDEAVEKLGDLERRMQLLQIEKGRLRQKQQEITRKLDRSPEVEKEESSIVPQTILDNYGVSFRLAEMARNIQRELAFVYQNKRSQFPSVVRNTIERLRHQMETAGFKQVMVNQVVVTVWEDAIDMMAESEEKNLLLKEYYDYLQRAFFAMMINSQEDWQVLGRGVELAPYADENGDVRIETTRHLPMRVEKESTDVAYLKGDPIFKVKIAHEGRPLSYLFAPQQSKNGQLVTFDALYTKPLLVFYKDGKEIHEYSYRENESSSGVILADNGSGFAYGTDTRRGDFWHEYAVYLNGRKIATLEDPAYFLSMADDGQTIWYRSYNGQLEIRLYRNEEQVLPGGVTFGWGQGVHHFYASSDGAVVSYAGEQEGKKVIVIHKGEEVKILPANPEVTFRMTKDGKAIFYRDPLRKKGRGEVYRISTEDFSEELVVDECQGFEIDPQGHTIFYLMDGSHLGQKKLDLDPGELESYAVMDLSNDVSWKISEEGEKLIYVSDFTSETGTTKNMTIVEGINLPIPLGAQNSRSWRIGHNQIENLQFIDQDHLLYCAENNNSWQVYVVDLTEPESTRAQVRLGVFDPTSGFALNVVEDGQVWYVGHWRYFPDTKEYFSDKPMNHIWNLSSPTDARKVFYFEVGNFLAKPDIHFDKVLLRLLQDRNRPKSDGVKQKYEETIQWYLSNYIKPVLSPPQGFDVYPHLEYHRPSALAFMVGVLISHHVSTSVRQLAQEILKRAVEKEAGEIKKELLRQVREWSVDFEKKYGYKPILTHLGGTTKVERLLLDGLQVFYQRGNPWQDHTEAVKEMEHVDKVLEELAQMDPQLRLSSAELESVQRSKQTILEETFTEMMKQPIDWGLFLSLAASFVVLFYKNGKFLENKEINEEAFLDFMKLCQEWLKNSPPVWMTNQKDGEVRSWREVLEKDLIGTEEDIEGLINHYLIPLKQAHLSARRAQLQIQKEGKQDISEDEYEKSLDEYIEWTRDILHTGKGRAQLLKFLERLKGASDLEKHLLTIMVLLEGQGVLTVEKIFDSVLGFSVWDQWKKATQQEKMAGVWQEAMEVIRSEGEEPQGVPALLAIVDRAVIEARERKWNQNGIDVDL